MPDKYVVVSPDPTPLATGAALGVQRRNAGNTAWENVAEELLVRNAMAEATADFNANARKITNLGAPTAAGDAATKSYTDAAVAGARDPKDSCRLATAAAPAAYARVNNVITFSAVGSQSVDGVVTALNDRLLLKDGAAGADNGIYSVTTKGTAGVAEVWTRTTDADTDAEVTAGMFAWVTEGTANGDSGWLLTTNDPITLNTTALTFTQVSGLGQVTAGAGMTKTGNTLDVVAANASVVVNADSVEVGYGVAGSMVAAISDAGAALAGTSALAARIDHKHLVATAAPSTVGTANAQGSSQSLARADHVHDHGAQTAGTHHAAVISNGTAGFMTGADKLKLDNSARGNLSGGVQTAVTTAVSTTLDTLSTNNVTRAYYLNVAAVKSDGTKGFSATVQFAVRRAGGNNSIVGTTVISYVRDDVNWTVTISLSGNDIQVTVQDSTAGPETVNWTWNTMYSEAP